MTHDLTARPATGTRRRASGCLSKLVDSAGPGDAVWSASFCRRLSRPGLPIAVIRTCRYCPTGRNPFPQGLWTSACATPARVVASAGD